MVLPHRRVLVFLAANEAGGSAYLYRILKTTRHPLHIVYSCHRKGEGTHSLHFLKQNEQFANALRDSDSSIGFYQSPMPFLMSPSQNLPMDNLGGIRKLIPTFGDRPISYIFVNGHMGFGHHRYDSEQKTARAMRIDKYWAPYAGALTKIAVPDPNNKYDYQPPYFTTQAFVSKMSEALSSLLPFVRNDGEGNVVVKTPAAGKLKIIRSRQMRVNFMNPTPYFYECSLVSLRSAVSKLAKGHRLESSHWPNEREWPGICDIFAKSAIKLYKSLEPFENIRFQLCAHDPKDINGPVNLLLEPTADNTAVFTEGDLASASAGYPKDLEPMDELQPEPVSLIRWTDRRLDQPSILVQGTKTDWLADDLKKKPSMNIRKKLTKRDSNISLVRSVIPSIEIDRSRGFPTRWAPFPIGPLPPN